MNIICTEYKRFGPKKTFRLQRFTREIAKGFLFMYLPLSQKLPVVNCGPCLQITRLFTFYKTVLYLCILHLSHKLRVFNFCLCLQITRLQGKSNTFGWKLAKHNYTQMLPFVNIYTLLLQFVGANNGELQSFLHFASLRLYAFYKRVLFNLYGYIFNVINYSIFCNLVQSFSIFT